MSACKPTVFKSNHGTWMVHWGPSPMYRPAKTWESAVQLALLIARNRASMSFLEPMDCGQHLEAIKHGRSR